MPVSVPRQGEKEAILEYINDLIDSGTLNVNFVEYTTDQHDNTQLIIGGPNWEPHSIGGDHYLIYKPHADLREQVGINIDSAIGGSSGLSTPRLLPHEGGKRKKTRRRHTKKDKRKKKRTKRHRKK